MSAAIPGFVGTYDDDGKLTRVRVQRGTHYRRRRRHRHRQSVQPRSPERRLAGRGSQPAAPSPDPVHWTPSRRPSPCGGVKLFGELGRPVPRVNAPTARHLRGASASSSTPGIRRTGTARTAGSASMRSVMRCCCPKTSPARIRGERQIDWSSIAWHRARRRRLVYAPGSGIPFYGGRRTRFPLCRDEHVSGRPGRRGVLGYDVAPAGQCIVRVHARTSAATKQEPIAIPAVVVAH